MKLNKIIKTTAREKGIILRFANIKNLSTADIYEFISSIIIQSDTLTIKELNNVINGKKVSPRTPLRYLQYMHEQYQRRGKVGASESGPA
jgi:replication initiation and membrane attachment protein DnaB